MTSNGKRAVIAVIYARVSTKAQNLQPQISECLKLINARDNWSYSGPSFDTASGAKEDRPGLDSLLDRARRGSFNVVVVSRIDRLARSVTHLLKTLQELQEYGVEVVSVHEPIDTTTSIGKALVGMLGVFAELERNLINERIKVGIMSARERGVKLGRPKTIFDKALVLELHGKGLSPRKIARELNKHRITPIHRSVIYRFLLKKKGGKNEGAI